MQPGWCQPIRQEFIENECEALPGVAYPGVRDNRSTINTKTGYDDDDDDVSGVTIVNCVKMAEQLERVLDFWIGGYILPTLCLGCPYNHKTVLQTLDSFSNFFDHKCCQSSVTVTLST